MKFAGFKLLKKLAKEREMNLGEVKDIIPKKFNDHRDFHILASLYTGGYIDTDLDRESSTMNLERNDEVAEMFYTMTFGPGAFEYRGKLTNNGGDFNEKVTIFCTAKADFYFAEQREKQKERVIVLAIGVAIAIISAIASALATVYFPRLLGA